MCRVTLWDSQGLESYAIALSQGASIFKLCKNVIFQTTNFIAVILKKIIFINVVRQGAKKLFQLEIYSKIITIENRIKNKL